MRPVGDLDKEMCQLIYTMCNDPPALQESEDRQGRILDADYSKVDIESMVDDLNIPTTSKTKLKRTLYKFPLLFGGGLGKLKIKPVSVELKEGAKPSAARFC